MAERLAHAEKLSGPDEPMDTTPAYELLSNSVETEHAFSRQLNDDTERVISWDQVADAWAEAWSDTARRLQARMPAMNVGMLWEVLADDTARSTLAEAAVPLLIGKRTQDRDRQLADVAFTFTRSWFAVVLARAGFTWHTGPGDPVTLRRDDVLVDPGQVCADILSGEFTAEMFEALCGLCALSPDSSVPLDEAQRTEAMERRAPVKVTRKNKGADVATRMDSLVFPETCTVCCGSTEYNVEATLQKSRLLGDPLAINVLIHACEAHKDKAHEALSLEQYNEKTTDAVIHCTNAAYAELLERCNA